MDKQSLIKRIKAGILEEVADIEALNLDYENGLFKLDLIYRFEGKLDAIQCDIQDRWDFDKDDFMEILNEIINTIRFNIDIQILKSKNLDITKFDSIKSQICYTLARPRDDHFKDVIHRKYLDMIVYFYILISVETNWLTRIEITKNTLEYWGITEDEVIECAVENTSRLLPYYLVLLNDIMPEIDSEEQRAVYSLTNKLEIQGACSIMYPHLLQDIADKINDDLVIVLATSNEALITGLSTYSNQESLSELGEVARKMYAVVGDKEKLSDRVYLYKRDDGKICLLI